MTRALGLPLLLALAAPVAAQTRPDSAPAPRTGDPMPTLRPDVRRLAPMPRAGDPPEQPLMDLVRAMAARRLVRERLLRGDTLPPAPDTSRTRAAPPPPRRSDR